jgi:hypothetical protein
VAVDSRGAPATDLATQGAASSSGSGAGNSGSGGAPGGARASGEAHALSPERLAHLRAFGQYRVTWDELARVGGTATPKFSLSAPAGTAEAPRTREEWANTIVAELQASNDKVGGVPAPLPHPVSSMARTDGPSLLCVAIAQVKEMRRTPRRDDKEVEKVRGVLL